MYFEASLAMAAVEKVPRNVKGAARNGNALERINTKEPDAPDSQVGLEECSLEADKRRS